MVASGAAYALQALKEISLSIQQMPHKSQYRENTGHQDAMAFQHAILLKTS